MTSCFHLNMFFINHTDGIACISDAGCHFASEITYFSLSTVLSVQILRFQDPGIAFHNTVNFFFFCYSTFKLQFYTAREQIQN